MALVVQTSDPSGLLVSLYGFIEEGKVRSWTCDEDGDLTPSAEQWRNKAWLKPHVKETRLIFTLIPPKGVKITKTTYAFVHARFTEMLLTHFDEVLESVRVTSMPSFGDRV